MGLVRFRILAQRPSVGGQFYGVPFDIHLRHILPLLKGLFHEAPFSAFLPFCSIVARGFTTDSLVESHRPWFWFVGAHAITANKYQFVLMKSSDFTCFLNVIRHQI